MPQAGDKEKMAVVSYYKVGGGGLTVVVRLAAKNNALGSDLEWRRWRVDGGAVCRLAAACACLKKYTRDAGEKRRGAGRPALRRASWYA